jgi:hypothetical protein
VAKKTDTERKRQHAMDNRGVAPDEFLAKNELDLVVHEKPSSLV